MINRETQRAQQIFFYKMTNRANKIDKKCVNLDMEYNFFKWLWSFFVFFTCQSYIFFFCRIQSYFFKVPELYRTAEIDWLLYHVRNRTETHKYGQHTFKCIYHNYCMHILCIFYASSAHVKYFVYLLWFIHMDILLMEDLMWSILNFKKLLSYIYYTYFYGCIVLWTFLKCPVLLTKRRNLPKKKKKYSKAAGWNIHLRYRGFP